MTCRFGLGTWAMVVRTTEIVGGRSRFGGS